MPSIVTEIQNVDESIRRNVLQSVVTSILSNLGIDDADVIYNDAVLGQHQPGSAIGQTREVSFGNTDKVIVETSEQRNSQSNIIRAVGRDNAVPFFKDKQYGVTVLPSMVLYETTVTLQRRATSRNTITHWLNELSRKIDMGGSLHEVEADFMYVVPVPIMNLINDCYKTIYYDREANETLGDYIKRNASKALTVVTNQAGNEPTFVVRNTQVRIVGNYEERPERPEKSDNATSWIGEVRFKFEYDRPEGVVANYPIMLRGTLVPEDWWIDNIAPGTSDEEGAEKSVFINAGDQIVDYKPYIETPVFLPRCDAPEINLPDTQGTMYKYVYIHLEFDESEITDTQKLFNLSEMGEYGFTDEVYDYIKLSYAEDPTGQDSVIRVYLFENDYVVREAKVAIDQDFNVWFDGLINIDKMYRSVIAIDTSLHSQSNEHFDYLRQSPKFVKGVLADFAPLVSQAYVIDDTVPTVPSKQLDEVQQVLRHELRPYLLKQSRITVLNGRILTFRGDL